MERREVRERERGKGELREGVCGDILYPNKYLGMLYNKADITKSTISPDI